MPVNEKSKKILLSLNDLDNSDSYLASTSLAPAKKTQNTSSEEDLDASLKIANETYKNVSILEFDDCDPSETRNVFILSKLLQK
jgi:hypothetical protein